MKKKLMTVLFYVSLYTWIVVVGYAFVSAALEKDRGTIVQYSNTVYHE